jgi:hypothetical protein
MRALKMSGKDYDGEGMRKEPYKVDSTKGSSLIDPVNYKNDMLVQVWMDSRILASLMTWMDKNGNYARFLSEIVREPIKAIVETLVSAGDMELIDDTIMAREMLERRFKVDLSRGGRGGKNTLHNKVLSEKRKEVTESLKGGYRPNDVARPNSNSQIDRDRGVIMLGGKRYIPLEEYPEYTYEEGNIDQMNQVIDKLKAAGIKSRSEKLEEIIAQGIISTRAIKGDDHE